MVRDRHFRGLEGSSIDYVRDIQKYINRKILSCEVSIQELESELRVLEKRLKERPKNPRSLVLGVSRVKRSMREKKEEKNFWDSKKEKFKTALKILERP